MARAQSPRELAGRLDGFAGRLQQVQRDAVNAAAAAVAREVRQEIQRVAGADMRLSGVGKRGAKVGARYDQVVGFRNPSATVRAVGPLHLVERPTKAHAIPKARKRRSRRRRVVNIPGVGVRASAQHPGTKGQRPFERGVNRGVRKAPAAFAEVVDRELRRAFR